MKKITESELKQIIRESVKTILKEKDHMPIGTVVPSMIGSAGSLNDRWHGIPDIRFIWHGEWSDPELEYDGNYYNGTEAEDALWSMYIEDGGNENDDTAYEKFCRENGLNLILDMEPTEEVEQSPFDECKKTIKLSEGKFKEVIREIVWNTLNEGKIINNKPYFPFNDYARDAFYIKDRTSTKPGFSTLEYDDSSYEDLSDEEKLINRLKDMEYKKGISYDPHDKNDENLSDDEILRRIHAQRDLKQAALKHDSRLKKYRQIDVNNKGYDDMKALLIGSPEEVSDKYANKKYNRLSMVRGLKDKNKMRQDLGYPEIKRGDKEYYEYLKKFLENTNS